jgi:hypothetical protein
MSDSTLSRRSAALSRPNPPNKLPTENSEEPENYSPIFHPQIALTNYWRAKELICLRGEWVNLKMQRSLIFLRCRTPI